MSSFLRALQDGYMAEVQTRPADMDAGQVMAWEGGLDRNGIWYRWRIVEAIGWDDDWGALPDDRTTDMREAETYADGIVTWEAEVEMHDKPDGFVGWGRVEDWHRCMREIMTAARAAMTYTDGAWPEVQP